MQQAVLQHYPHTDVRYSTRPLMSSLMSYTAHAHIILLQDFTNRRPSDRFTRETFNWIQQQIAKLPSIALKPDERAWLERRCPYFTSSYLDYLQSFHFKPDQQVVLEFKDAQVDPQSGVEYGSIDLGVQGNWAETILYEIPLMSIISEGYFMFTQQSWDYVGQRGAHPFLLSLTPIVPRLNHLFFF